MVKEAFRQTKDNDLVTMMPFRHWADSKIRCHILTCIVSLAYLRIIEIRLRRAGMYIAKRKAMDSMHRLLSILSGRVGRKNLPGSSKTLTSFRSGSSRPSGLRSAKGSYIPLLANLSVYRNIQSDLINCA